MALSQSQQTIWAKIFFPDFHKYNIAAVKDDNAITGTAFAPSLSALAVDLESRQGFEVSAINEV